VRRETNRCARGNDRKDDVSAIQLASGSKFISRLTILVLIPMAVYLWTGWLIWAILLEISSFRHPQVGEWPKISGVRSWLAIFALAMLALTLTPAPFAHTR